MTGSVATLAVRTVENERYSYSPRLVSLNENDQTCGCQYQLSDSVVRALCVTHPLALALADPDVMLYGQYINVRQRDLSQNSTFEQLLPLSPRCSDST